MLKPEGASEGDKEQSSALCVVKCTIRCRLPRDAQSGDRCCAVDAVRKNWTSFRHAKGKSRTATTETFLRECSELRTSAKGFSENWIFCCIKRDVPVPVARRSKAWVCGRSFAGIAGSNLASSMDICLL